MRNLKKFLALVLATLMVVSAMVATTASAAVTADHSNAVEVLNRIDVYRGYGADAMGDKDLVTRWHMALFVSRITTGFTDDAVWNTTTNDTPFTDVTKDNYLGAIATAYKAGIIEGVGNNKFDPNANIKYQDALTMVVRALGWNDLAYPAGYIQKAQALGLTDNLEELDNNLGVAITRGQTAEILYNALFVEAKDGTVLAEDVLKLDLADVVVVATENQSFNYSELAAKGKVIVKTEDDEYISIDADELLADGEKSDDLLGYAFKIATNNNYKTLVTAYRCDSDVLVNYGTTQADMTYVQVGNAPNVTYRTNMIKIKGTNYNWGTESVSGSKYMVAYEAGTVTTSSGVAKIHYFDTDGNIVNPTTGVVVLYLLNGKYMTSVGTTGFAALREATAAEIEAAKFPYYVSTGTQATYTTYNCYTAIANGQSDKVWNNKFCELKVFDPDNDGDWDYGLFTPYYVGVYGTVKSNGETYVSDFAKDSTSTTKSKDLIAIDGVALTAYTGKTARAGALVDAITFVGAKPAAGDTIIYTFNAFTGEFEVIENLGTLKRGVATEINGRGSYVIIDNNKYFYNLTAANLNGWAASDINLNLIQAVIVDRTYAVDYLAVAGYLLETGKVNPYGYTSFAAFTWSDMVKIDAAGNLVVKALVDATGVKKEIAISDVENFKLGVAMNDWLKNNGYVTGNSYWVGSSASTVTNAVLVNALGYALSVTGAPDFTKNIYAAKVNADGTYSLIPFTPETSYDPITNKFDKDEVNVVDNMNAATITLNYGINNAGYVTSVAGEDKLIATAGKFDTTADATYIFVGMDDIHVFKGVAPNGAKIHLELAGTVLMNATANCVFVVNKGVAVTSLYEGWDATTTTTPTKDYVFYAIVKDTKAYINSATAANESTLTVTGLYNVLTGEKVDIVVTADHATVTFPVYTAINNKWAVSDASTSCANLILFSASEKRFELNDAVYTEFGTYLAEIWANYTTKNTAGTAKLGNLDDQYKLDFATATDINVQSYALTTFWGYDGSVEVVDGVNVKRNFNDSYDPDAEVVYYYITTTGNVYGYVFAPGMAK